MVKDIYSICPSNTRKPHLSSEYNCWKMEVSKKAAWNGTHIRMWRLFRMGRKVRVNQNLNAEWQFALATSFHQMSQKVYMKEVSNWRMEPAFIHVYFQMYERSVPCCKCAHWVHATFKFGAVHWYYFIPPAIKIKSFKKSYRRAKSSRSISYYSWCHQWEIYNASKATWSAISQHVRAPNSSLRLGIRAKPLDSSTQQSWITKHVLD
jgi:hypothetical protein